MPRTQRPHSTGPLVCWLLFGSFACERQAPGPSECVRVAERWMSTTRTEAMSDARMAEPFSSLVRECLTGPFDRELVSCLDEDRGKTRCRAEFRRRTEQRSETETR